jgi:hypothetical protein
MMKDRIGNKLAMGDKVVVALPEAQIFGFVAQLEEGGIITGVRGARGGMEKRPGRILVSCVIALPVDAEYDGVAQLVKVYDPDKHDAAGEPAEDRPN